MTGRGGEAKYARAPGVESREAGGEMFLVAPTTQRIVNLNPLASACWRALDTPRTLDELVALFADAFPDIAPRKIRADITKLTGKLLALGVLKQVVGKKLAAKRPKPTAKRTARSRS